MRLFIAVNFTDPFRKILTDCQNQLIRGQEHQRFTLTREENLHLTLAFIGEYPRPKDVTAALDPLEWEEFSISPDSMGRFGDLWWMGIKNGGDAVNLGNKVRSLLEKNGIPFDRKPMKPHITLVRELKLGEIPDIRPGKAEMSVKRISLMRSERINGKLTYTEIWSKNIQEK